MRIAAAFVATPAEVPAIGPNDFPLQKFAGDALRGVKVANLAKLLSIVRPVSPDSSLAQFSIVAEPYERESCVYQMAPALCEFLATVDEGSGAKWADQWFRSDAFDSERYTASDAQEDLRCLATLARTATATKRGLYLWCTYDR